MLTTDSLTTTTKNMMRKLQLVNTENDNLAKDREKMISQLYVFSLFVIIANVCY